MPAPIGTHACQWQNAQAAAAEADDFVVYQHEWAGASEQLGPDGRRHLDAIAYRLPTVPFSVIIAESDNPQLDETRRGVVVAGLMDRGIADAPQRVQIGYPLAEGLYGPEAVRYGDRRAIGGTAGGGIGGGIGSMGGIGMGMGGMGIGGGIY